VIEGPVKSKEDLDSLVDRFAEDVTPCRSVVRRDWGERSLPNIARSLARPCVANQQSIRDATWEIRAGLLSLKRSAGANIDIDIDTLEVKTSQSKRARGAPGRLRDHDSVSHVVCMESDFSRKRDRRTSRQWPRRRGKWRTLGTEGSSRQSHDQRSSHPGDLLDECFLRLENPS
jgi:hypothetical protein